MNKSKKLIERKKKALAYLNVQTRLQAAKEESKMIELQILSDLQQIKKLKQERDFLQTVGIDRHDEE